ncbi:S1 family peptidase [bacterium]|nr:S1 family peptidase [bacterium]
MDVREFLVRLVRYVIIFVWTSRVMAGTTDPSTPDSKYVEFGKSFPNVVQISNTIDCKKCNKTHSQIASAVVIQPHWVLTAAHVVKDSRNNVVIKDGFDHPLTYVVIHKDYDEDNVGFHDIALAYTPAPIKLEFYPALYRKTDETGKAITIAGFGIYGTFTAGGKESDGKRRAGHNKIDSTERAVLLAAPSVTGRFPLEFGITPGDSGGGMFIGNELAGINSFLAAEDGKPDGTYGDDSAFTRISLYADWVDSQIVKYSQAQQGRATTGNTVEDIPVIK